MNGQKIGAYEIVAKIGEGGMGEVYRAHDSSLNRDVAIKVLLPDVANDAERLARFRREAQLLAALNHPNIAHIYGLEGRDGREGQEGRVGQVGLVMELVEGPTLAEIIEGRRGSGLPIDEALAIAKQIAGALEAAHEQGIVHRDLKPANIKVKADGTVKVLDFGLAKALEGPSGAGGTGGPGGAASASMSPTITSPAVTRVGTILGTAAYMSPEQARGRAVDRRADMWAFGCVLYEMLAGRRAFAGEDVTETLAEIMKSEPDWKALPPMPPLVVGLLRQSLKKDPHQRLADASVFRLALDGNIELPQASLTSPPVSRPRNRWVPASLAAGALIAASALVIAPLLRRQAPLSAPPTRFTIPLPGGVRFGQPYPPRISRDGRTIAFQGMAGGVTQVYVRRLDALDAVPLRGTEGAVPAAFSPDGEWLAVRSSNGMLQKVRLSGGPLVPIAVDPNVGDDWGADDTILMGGLDALATVPAAAGTPKKLTASASNTHVAYLGPILLPGARDALFFGYSNSGRSRLSVGTMSFRTGSVRELVPGSSPTYLASGHLVFTRDASLWAVLFDPSAVEVRGEAVPVVEGIASNSIGFGSYAVAPNGTLVYVPASSTPEGRTLVWVDQQGHEDPLPLPPAPYESPRFSPDGRRILLQIAEIGQSRLVAYDLDRRVLTSLTLGGDDEFWPAWTPDGRVTFSSYGRSGVANLYVKAADGTGQAQRLTTSDNPQAAAAWTPDGHALLFAELEKGTVNAKAVFVGTPNRIETIAENVGEPAISPDGHWVAFAGLTNGHFDIYVRPFPNTSAGVWQVSHDGGNSPMWSPDGRALFYRAASMHMMRVAVETRPTLRTGNPEPLFPYTYRDASFDHTRPFTITPDGKRFLMIKEQAQESGPHLVVVEHWDEELKRLVKEHK